MTPSTDQSAASIPTADCEMLEDLPFSLGSGVGARARIGLVVLQSDYTIEHELRTLLTPLTGVDFYVSKVSNDLHVTPATLAAMGPRIAASAEQLLTTGDLQVIAYGCTSASVVLGPARVAEYVHETRPDVAVSNPITAAFAALNHIGAKRIGVLTPYTRDVNTGVREAFIDNGFDVPVFGSFNEPNDARVAAIDAVSLRNAVLMLAERAPLDAVFVSCTSIRLVDEVHALEDTVGLPVISSNMALAWHCLRLAGVADAIPGYGTLLAGS